GEAATLAEELWTRWPKEHRFGLLLVECLGALSQVERRRVAIEELGQRIERYQGEARQELAQRQEQGPGDPEKEVPMPDARQRRQQYEERQLRELARGRPQLLEWLLISQALLEQKPAEARQRLKQLAESDNLGDGLSQRIAGGLAELGDLEGGRAVLEALLESDAENPHVHAQLAAVHSKAGRFDEAILAATESLSLLYFQPGVHALLGRALMETRHFPEAEKELLVAVAQSPRNLAAHELLGKLYREQLDRPADAFAHEGLARSLRHELAARRRADSAKDKSNTSASIRNQAMRVSETKDGGNADVPSSFGREVDVKNIITIVSGLPRSGTSLMMQLLTAAGIEALTDAKRAADEDNPLGYFEFEKTLALAKDNSWLPEARGKVVKIVAQLLPFLPRNEHYHVIFMERNLTEAIASQNAMLARQGRHGAELEERRLSETYAAQLSRVRKHLAKRSDIRTLFVNFESMLENPASGVERIANFLGGELNRKAAEETIRPELRHQK
ncbi:MAG TPA: sulfotransferase, partial [Verrucomicrobiae bacterium]|nr:sulfotransferase [Verrucomicrobiae bacterium]